MSCMKVTNCQCEASLLLSDVWLPWLLVSFSLSVAIGGRGNCPGLYCSLAKQSVDRRPQQVDGSSNVENHLPLFYGVLQPFDRDKKLKEPFSSVLMLQTHTASLTSHQIRAVTLVYCSGIPTALLFVGSQCPLVDTTYNPGLTKPICSVKSWETPSESWI